MNDAHLHLAINHLPIIIPFIGLLVMIGGFLTKSNIVKRVAYLIFILGAIATFPAAATGEGAEEIAEHLPGVSHDIIHEHEELAETFILLSYALGALSIFGLWANKKHKSFSNMTAFVTIALGIVVLIFGARTGSSGGEIRHTEIRADFTPGADEGHEEQGESNDDR